MQSPPKPMSPNPDNLMPQPFENPPMATSNGAAVTISTQVMIAAVIFLFMAVVFIFFLYLYAKYYMGSDSLHRRRAHFVFAAPDPVPNGDRGLDAELLKALPIKSYSPSEFQEGLECAVCLSEISEGEKLRLLPKCSHGFHVECIDMWFQSHSTCPLCRVPVMVTGEAEAEAEADIEQGNSLNLNFPTNVLFWGNQEQVRNGAESLSQTEEGTSSSSKLSKKPEGMLVIDIPRRSVEEFFSPMVSPLPTSKFSSEEMKTPKTPRSARLRSLTKLLNRGKMVIASSSPSSSSPKGGDIEQGLGVGSSTLGPKTPASK